MIIFLMIPIISIEINRYFEIKLESIDLSRGKLCKKF